MSAPLWIPLVFSIIIFALAYRYEYKMEDKEKNALARVEIAAFVAMIVAGFFHINIIIFTIGAILFALLAHYYSSDKQYVLAAAAFLYVFVAYSTLLSPEIIAGAAVIGIISQLRFQKSSGSKNNKEVEIRRDMFQILLGLIVIFIFYMFPKPYSALMITLAIIFGYIFAGIAASATHGNKAFELLAKMEREDVILGAGAIWLAVGSLIVIAVLGNTSYIIPVITTIFIADSGATIIGISIKGPALPYNSKKTISGTLAYFIIAALAFSLLGYIGILIAFIAAVAESLPVDIDDNLLVPIVLCALLIF
jgi:dolichol kinase